MNLFQSNFIFCGCLNSASDKRIWIISSSDCTEVSPELDTKQNKAAESACKMLTRYSDDEKFSSMWKVDPNKVVNNGRPVDKWRLSKFSSLSAIKRTLHLHLTENKTINFH